jgi:hypothetical protein
MWLTTACPSTRQQGATIPQLQYRPSWCANLRRCWICRSSSFRPFEFRICRTSSFQLFEFGICRSSSFRLFDAILGLRHLSQLKVFGECPDSVDLPQVRLTDEVLTSGLPQHCVAAPLNSSHAEPDHVVGLFEGELFLLVFARPHVQRTPLSGSGNQSLAVFDSW